MTGNAVAVMPQWKEAILGAEARFLSIAEKHQLVEWARESMFAIQAMEKNEFLRSVAERNPKSLQNAIFNVAAVGLTLNPASQYAALVPRDGAICLDVMYRGFIRLATDAGAIVWAQAEIVYSTDTFKYRGKLLPPEHGADPFSPERGAIVGVYCVAKTADGDYLTEVMRADEVNEIRDCSEYWKKKQAGPWKTQWGEMAKKTVIKRGRKTWPESRDQRQAERLQNAVEFSNRADGYPEVIEHQPQGGITAHDDTITMDERHAAVRKYRDRLDTIKAALKTCDYQEAAQLWYSLSDREQEVLWFAQKNGGPFTAAERKQMQEPQFRQAYYVPDERPEGAGAGAAA